MVEDLLGNFGNVHMGVYLGDGVADNYWQFADLASRGGDLEQTSLDGDFLSASLYSCDGTDCLYTAEID